MERTSILNGVTLAVSKKDMHTGDPYLGMQVTIRTKGPLKGHKGVVTGTQFKEKPAVPEGTIVAENTMGVTAADIIKMVTTGENRIIKEKNTIPKKTAVKLDDYTTVTVKTTTQAVNTIVQCYVSDLTDNRYADSLSS